MRSWLSLTALAATFLVVPGIASAVTTLVVDDDGMAVPGDCDDTTPTPHITIASAIAAATAGDIIEVCPGAYTESVIVNKPLTINGAKAGVPAGPDAVPAGRGADESVVTGTGGNVFEVRNPSTIDGFTFVSNPGSTSADGVYLRSGAVGSTIVNNVITYGAASAPTSVAVGIFTQNFRSYSIGWNNVQGFRYGGYFDGDDVSDPSIVESNYFGDNTLDGIFVSGNKTQSSLFKDNLIEGTTGSGILTTSAHEFSGNTIQDNHWGIVLWATANMHDALIADNNILNNGVGIKLFSDHAGAMNNEAHNNNIVGNTVGVMNHHSASFDATCNWWGDASGPSGDGPGSGDAISKSGDPNNPAAPPPNPGPVYFVPWLTGPAPGGECDGRPDQKAKGDGEFVDDEGNTVEFKFKVETKPGELKGEVEIKVKDDLGELKYKTKGISDVEFVDATEVTFSGTGVGGYEFEVNATDTAKPGAGFDTFSIDVTNAGNAELHYDGTLTDGDVKIEPPK